MKFAVSVVLWLSLCPTGAGLGFGSLKVSGHEGVPLPGAKETAEQTGQVQKKPLTNADIISMVKAGLAESTIVLDIQLSSTDFDTSPPELISLKSHGVPQKVLDAMLTAGSAKPIPPPAPPEHPQAINTKGSPPDFHKIRKVYLEMEWAMDDDARPRDIRAIEKHTCLRVVDTPEAADAILNWTVPGFTGASLVLLNKDRQPLWGRSGMTPPLKALKQVVGCP